MNFSAAASSSPVVTPGRALPRRISWQRTSTLPAAAILSISAGVLRTITSRRPGRRAERPSKLGLEAQRGERRPDVAMHFLRRAIAVEGTQEAGVPVPLDHRLGLL